MGLVTYSDSEGSDDEASAPATATSKPSAIDKATFKKVVDSSNPHKIRVNLPEPAKPSTTDGDQDEEGPRVKRVRTSGSVFSDFNSLLPTPKRDAGAKGPSTGNGVKRVGLGAGVNLKTGATPGFSRDPVSHDAEEAVSYQAGTPSLELLKPAEGGPNSPESNPTVSRPLQSTVAEPPKKATMFKPLSVARKPKTKKTITKPDVSDGTGSSSVTAESKPQVKKSLFSSIETDDHSNRFSTKTESQYEPLIYQAEPEADNEESAAGYPAPDLPLNQNNPPVSDPNSLSSIADTLNLSASAKRQLLGRKGRNASSADASAISVANFNMDSEYAANELLRQAGEQVQHNPVRSINAAGKNSLKQLVSTATSQKDALDEQFAAGRRNKKEAGGKYGW